MANQYRTRNQIVAVEVEAVAGTDPVPVVGTDAMACRAPAWQGSLDVLNTDDEVTGALDTPAPIPGGGGPQFQTSVYLKGSGAGQTAPEFTPSFRIAGCSVTAQAADYSNTAQAGAAGSITLDAAASAVDDFHKGKPIRTTGGTGSGQTRIVTAYNGTTKVATITPNWTTTPDATTTFTIAKNNLIKPTSTLVNGSVYNWKRRSDAGNARLRKLLNAAATLQMQFANKQLPIASFGFMGVFVKPSDVADPGDPTLQTTRARPLIGVDCALGGTTTKFSQITIDAGLQVEKDDDPSATYGDDAAGITQRKITGRINPPMDLLSVRDVWQDFLDGTERSLWLRWGSTAGNRVSLLLPRIVYTGSEDEDVKGFGKEGIPFGSVGLNTGFYLCFD